MTVYIDLGETIHATVHFEVDPRVTGNLVELVIVIEFKGDVCKLDGDVLCIRRAKQDDNYGASNILLPCPGS
jgi:hypothetical protein